MDEQGLVETLNAGSRKKKRKDRSEYRKTTYADDDPLCINYTCPCDHKSLKTFKCKKLTLQDIMRNRKLFFKRRGKIEQDIYLSRLLAPYEPLNRGKSSPRATVKNRKVSCTYHLYINKKLSTVCKKVFQKTFSIGEKRLRNLNVMLSQGETPTEKRGGDRKSAKSREKKEKLREFLKKLPAQESHYNRQKSKRIYLSSELNSARLHKIYNLSVPTNLKVSRTMFDNIFCNEFNIGFKSPATDACSVCILWSNKIKNETDSQRKQVLIVEKRVHKLRSNVFYDLLRTPTADSIRLCFDLQKVLPLPRTPIQDAFYSRQISFYNFCITELDKNKPDFFVWDETQASRGSLEIGSALLTYLTNLPIPENVKYLKLYCDGCGGQNKNSHILHLLIYWLVNNNNSIEEITITFPVRGHSFLPADRIFGRIEKDIRKIPIITHRAGYIEIIEKHGKVHDIGSDWLLKDIKKFELNYKKLTKIQTAKRIKIRKIKGPGGRFKDVRICAFENYRFESGTEEFESLLKRGKRHPKQLQEHPIGKGLTVNKKKDVTALLVKQFGEEWAMMEDLQWYKNILLNEHNTLNEDEEHDHEESECICMEDDIGDIRV